ncbi:LysR family transcriptional regulator [Paracoccus xiamenensis]|uniref:LysR family transcriptional regulator n=1 Tax=Paracoccus xiamenensis TaxID=2714901 RepID=UPI00140A7475|nr:LysR substrate-binding domain-containing protein [Paracoccus xiamenensis]NHF72014.1 LysR family transcriptional regulator [Paracoccus xiamenensis]
MELALLEDFLELARELNFSRAAANRNMTQPAFSRRIRTLEDAVQTPLVTRTTRQVALTPAGIAFQPRAATMVRLLADARAEILEIAGRAERSLNLAATHALSYTFIPRWLMGIADPAEFGALNMVSDTQRQCLHLIQRAEANFFICHRGQSSLPVLPERQFRSQVIGRDLLAPLCAPDQKGQPRWRIGDAAAPVIAYGPASGLHAIIEAHWSTHGRPDMAPAMSSVLAATNMEMAKAGQGIAFLPLSLAEADLQAGRLIRAGAPVDDIPVEIAIYRPRSRLSPHCEAFWRKITQRADIDAKPA